MSGFIALHREAFDHHLLQDAERFRAWFWLVSEACWKPSRTRIKGETVELERGELTYSVRFLADKWGWSKSRVDRFIADLRAEGMIETRSKNGTSAGHKAGQGQSIISICNYARYQDVNEAKRDNDNEESGTSAGQQRDKEEQGNKGTKNNIPPIVPPSDWPELPEWLPAEPWNGFLEMRRKKGKWPTGRAVKTIIGKLDEWRAKGHDPGAVLDHATENQWTTIYEPKEPRNDPPRGNRDGVAAALDRLGHSAGTTERPAIGDGRTDRGGTVAYLVAVR